MKDAAVWRGQQDGGLHGVEGLLQVGRVALTAYKYCHISVGYFIAQSRRVEYVHKAV